MKYKMFVRNSLVVLCAVTSLSGCLPIVLGVIYSDSASVAPVINAYDGESQKIEDVAILISNQVDVNMINNRILSSFSKSKKDAIFFQKSQQIDFLPGMHILETCFSVTESFHGSNSTTYKTYKCQIPSNLTIPMEAGHIYTLSTERVGFQSYKVVWKDETEKMKKNVLEERSKNQKKRLF